MAALVAGQGCERVAAEYNIPLGTVEGWKSKQGKGEVPIKTTDAQKTDIGELLVGYLRESLITLQFHQTTIFRDPEWLKQQDASELAVLHGVSADKVTRLTEALERAEPTPIATEAEA